MIEQETASERMVSEREREKRKRKKVKLVKE
jgi:hypothetical protein